MKRFFTKPGSYARAAILMVAGFLLWSAFSMVAKERQGYYGWKAFFQLDSANPPMYFGVCQKSPDELGKKLIENRLSGLYDVVRQRPNSIITDTGGLTYTFVMSPGGLSTGREVINWDEREKPEITFFYEERVENGKTFKIIRDFQYSAEVVYSAITHSNAPPCSQYSVAELKNFEWMKRAAKDLSIVRRDAVVAVSTGWSDSPDPEAVLPGRGQIESWSLVSYTLPYFSASVIVDMFLKKFEAEADKNAKTFADGSLDNALWQDYRNLLRYSLEQLHSEMKSGEGDCLLLYLLNLDTGEVMNIADINRREIYQFVMLVLAGLYFALLGSAPRLLVPWQIVWREKHDGRQTKDVATFLFKSVGYLFWPLFLTTKKVKDMDQGYWDRLDEIRNAEQSAADRLRFLQRKQEREDRRREELKEQQAALAAKLEASPQARVIPAESLVVPCVLKPSFEPPVESNEEKKARLKRQIEGRYPEFSDYEGLWRKLNLKDLEMLDEMTVNYEDNKEKLSWLFTSLSQHKVPSHLIRSRQSLVV